MAQLIWNDIGSHLFESGIDRGVLYIPGASGVPWNGLTGVDEKPSGASVSAYYMDGVRYATVVSSEEYAATLQAFYSPVEFDQCDGSLDLGYGFFAEHQARKSFGLSYRTRLGNDIDGSDYAYKIHIVYNAWATPSERAYKTIGADADIDSLSWDLQASPVSYSGIRPTAHFVLDATQAPESDVAALEEILYGSPSTNPRLPEPTEIISILAANNRLNVFDNGDGTYIVAGKGVTNNKNGSFSINDQNLIDHGNGSFTVSSQA